MYVKILLALVSAFLLIVGNATAGFDDDFGDRTLRVDFFHSGTAIEERIALDRFRLEGPWPGSRTQLVDPTGFGPYRVELTDAADGKLIYSRGFASIYGEWRTTGEAEQGEWRTFAEAVRVPEPLRPFRLRFLRRETGGAFAEITTLSIDPASRFVDRAPAPSGKVGVIAENGPIAVKVDLLFLADGYRADEADKFREDSQRMSDALFAEEPFASRRDDFNVRTVHLPSRHSGVSRPRSGLFRESPLGARYNSLDSERYILTLEDRRWRDAAAIAPYDAVIILVNERKYGGGGIFNLYATSAAHSAFAAYVVVHEFGHSFAGLADEYYTSPVAYETPTGPRTEPWETNVTALLDPTRLKWESFSSADTPRPTPWKKEGFEKRSRALQERRARLREQAAPEEQLEALFNEERDWLTDAMKKERHSGDVGAFEGAMYEASGLYRPAVDCIMFSRNDVGFCPVCANTINTIIDLYTR